ncbi:MAG: phosphomannomutase/phosphoglucomutase [Candidatus Aenigmarchaeota archaeon]|nr:phosphomannomutase/phosphoglucomutase [Candidatus Aenigmarchaeota archaeon]
MSSIFRSYDIRGIYPSEINEDVVYKTALAYRKILPKAKEIVVARDMRLSSPALFESLTRGLMDAGFNVIDIGMVPVSVFYFAIAHYKKDGGIMITASHNPKEYNGLKIQRENARPIVGETGIFEMEKYVLEGNFQKAEEKGTMSKKEVVDEYMRYIVPKIKLKRPLKIILDPGNGTCGKIPEKIFSSLGCTAKTIFAEPDGTFPNHAPDPHDDKNLVALQKEVVKNKAGIGFAFDGDGDRAGIVDEKGRIISMDFILMMLTRQALAVKKGDVVFEVRCPNTLIDDTKTHGGNPLVTRVGHSYLLDEIIDRSAVFGGELTGHMYFPYCYYNYDDAVFASLKIAEIVSALDIPFSEYIDSLPRAHASPEIFIDCDDDRKFKVVEELKTYLKENNYGFLGIDGARINFTNGWGLVRASNTTAHIKCRFEADTKEHLEEIIKEVSGIIQKFGLKLKY